MEASGFAFLKTAPGLFKVLETFSAFIAFISSLAFTTTWNHVHIAFFNTLLIIALCFTIAIIILNIIHLVKRVPHVPWNKLDCIMCVILAVLLFVSSTIWINYIRPISLSIAMIFGYITGILFLFNSIFTIMFTFN